MAASNLIVNLVANTNEAIKGLQGFQKEAQKSLSAVESSFSALKTVAIAAVGFIAAGKIAGAFSDIVDAAAESEQALQDLNTALALSGEYSEEASQSFQDLASTIQATTKFEDDAIIKQAALAKSYGLTNDQTQKLIKASVDLAAATGVSLDTAVQKLSKTYSGTAGQLAKSVPALKGLSEEALKSGAAIDIVAQKFSGTAASQVNTFSGALTQLKNVFGDFQEELGGVIVKNPQVIEAIKQVTKFISGLTESFKGSAGGVSAFVSSVVNLAFDAIPFFIDLIKFQGNQLLFLREIALKVALGFVSFYSGLLEFKIVQKVMAVYIDLLITNLKLLLMTASAVLDGFAKLTGTENFLNPITETIDKLNESLNSVDGEKAVDGLRKGFDAVGTSIAGALEESDSLFKNFNKGADDAKKTAQEMAEAVRNAQGGKGPKNLPGGKGSNKEPFDLKKYSEQLSKMLTEGTLGGVTAFIGALQAFIDFIPNLLASVTKLFTTATELPNKIVDGVDNLFSAIEGFVAKLIPNFVRGIPRIITSFFRFFAKGLPTAIRALLAELPNLITEFVSFFASELPNLINELAENLGPIIAELVVGLTEAMPLLINALIDSFIVKGGIVKLTVALIAAMPQIALGFVKALGGLLPGLFKSLAGNFSSGIKLPSLKLGDEAKSFLNGSKFVKALKEAFDNFIKSIKDALKVGGSSGGYIGQLGGKISGVGKTLGGGISNVSKSIGGAFADGGMVPPGFPNDSYPARLTSGEMVIPKDSVRQLETFLQRQQSNRGVSSQPQQITVNLQVGQEQLAKVMFNLNKQGFRTA